VQAMTETARDCERVAGMLERRIIFPAFEHRSSKACRGFDAQSV